MGIDLRPGMQEIRTFSELLQAEAGEMALRQPGNITQGPAAKPNNVVGVKSMSGPDSSGNPPKGASKGKPEDAAGSSTGRRGEKPELPINAANVVHKTACINWLTDKGCQYADRCRFTHTVLDSKDGRCFNCSGKGHSRRDCPAGKRSESRGPQGGSEEPKVAKTTRIRSRSQERKNGPEKEGGAAQEHSEPTVKINPMKESTVTITPVPEEANKVVGEVTNLLKGLNGPVLKSVGHGGDHLEVEFDDGTGLLDGGATHPLRQGSTEEIKNAVQVTVELAHGAAQLYQNPVNGTLLSEGPVEPIVPLRGLVELGYTITWSRAGCVVKHPRLGNIECWLRSGCPVVRKDHALALITEIEHMEMEKRTNHRLTLEEPTEKTKKWWGSRFPETPDRIWNYMRGQDEEDPQMNHDLPWNRHKRRRLLTSKGVIVHLFAGERAKEWRKNPINGIEVITLDINEGRNQDLHNPGTWSFLWKLASLGKLLAIIGGPPCRTVSRLKQKQPGPRPLRGRFHDRYGLPGLTDREKNLADSDAALLLKQIGLFIRSEECRERHRVRTAFLLESPQDPLTYVPQAREEESPSFWAWPELMQLLRYQGMGLVSFDQGCFGHSRRKPTTCLTNLEDMRDLEDQRSTKHSEALPKDIKDRCHLSSTWAVWAPGLRAAIREALHRHLKREGDETADEEPHLAKMTSEEAWEAHIRQGHRPYRRDCRTCVLEMGARSPHRRRRDATTSSWAMSVDIVGPFPKVRDLSSGKDVVKYAMVATALVPDYIIKTGGEDEDRPKEQQDQAPSRDIVMPCEESPEKGKPKILEPSWGDGLEEGDCPLGGEDHQLPESGEKDNSGKEEKGDPDPMTEEVKRLVEESKQPFNVRHVTLVELLGSRHVSEILVALGKCIAKFNTMGIRINRLHSDRAKELLSKKVEKWCSERLIRQSMTEGDDPASNGHMESEVNQLKRRTRLYLRVAGSEVTDWPQAMRYCAEERMRQQLEKLGVPVLSMLPFRANVLVRSKRWFKKGAIPSPYTEGRLLCPSPMMFSGWVVQQKDGKVVHAREVVVPSEEGERVRIRLEIEDNPERPHRRLYSKTPPEGVMRLPPTIGDAPLPPPDESPPEDSEPYEPSEMLEADEEPDEIDLLYEELNREDPEAPVEEIDSLGPEISKMKVEPAEVSAGGEPGNLFKSGKIKVSRVSAQDGPDSGEKHIERSPTSGEFIVRNVSLTHLLKVKEDQHLGVVEAIREELLNVPVDPTNGFIQGQVLRLLQEHREDLEEELEAVTTARMEEERRVCQLRVCSAQADGSGGEEQLQTVTVPLHKVRMEKEKWYDSMLAEYKSLTAETKAIRPVKRSEIDPEAELVPGKLVCVIKAGGRYKCRAVICGNLASPEADPMPSSLLYASGADGVLIRCALRKAAHHQWDVATTDIKTAFLLAPRPVEQGAKTVAVVPPRIMTDFGITQPDEVWLVDKALYGFQSSPAHWAVYRDQTMRRFTWQGDASPGEMQKEYKLEQTPEGNLWRILCKGGDAPGEEVRPDGYRQVGLVVVYVDDLMVLAEPHAKHSFLKRLKEEWTCSTPEEVDHKGWVRFCGFELQWSGQGDHKKLKVGQQSYTRDMLNRHQVEHPRPVPMTKADAELPEEEQPALENIRQAQTVVGELLWLSIRTRPDISFAVSQLGRQVNKRPKWVVKTAQQVFGYLKGTETQHLSYGVCTSDDRGPEDDLPFHREMQQVEMFSDISFAPAGERSLQGILGFYGGGLVQWEASRQAFVVLSTAEGELMSYLESMVMGDSLASLIEVVEGRKIGQKIIYGDNTAAIAILENPDGPWRTRHLRLRATALRERLKDGSWIIRHLPGVKLVADFLTKIIAVKPSWERFWRFVNHQGSGVPNEETSMGSNHREEQPLGEEQRPEEPDQETSSWDNYRDIAGRCVSVVKKVVGLAEEYPELADFRHEALSTAIGRLVRVLADAYRVTESVVKDRFQLESVLPFLEKKNIPGQVEHPVEEEPRGILKRGTRSKRGNPKPKRVYFWDENPPVLKVLRVQDHHGHVAQLHSYEKKNPSLRPSWVMDKRNLGTWIVPGPIEKNIELLKLYQGRVPQNRGIWLQLGELGFWGILMWLVRGKTILKPQRG